MQDWVDTVDDLELTPEETIDAGNDTVVNILRVSGKIRGSDTPVVSHLAMVVTLGTAR